MLSRTHTLENSPLKWDTANVLPAYHSITGCDTTSYPYKVGKVRPFKKMVEQNKFALLTSMGTLPISFQHLENMFTFMQTVMYPGKDGEDYVETRIRMYDKQKIKSSLGLLPDKHSSQEHLKRANLQVYIWKQCLNQHIDYPTTERNGWQQTEDGFVLVWFSSSQFPPSLCRKPPRKSKSGEEADDENSESEGRKKRPRPPKRGKRTQKSAACLNENLPSSKDTFSSASDCDSDFLPSSDHNSSDDMSDYSDFLE